MKYDKQTMLIKTSITPSALSILDTIMRLSRRGKPITIRAIGSYHGWTAGARIQRILQQLREAGLISKDDRKAGTIRPTCRWIPANELEH